MDAPGGAVRMRAGALAKGRAVRLVGFLCVLGLWICGQGYVGYSVDMGAGLSRVLCGVQGKGFYDRLGVRA